ncbi:hypothetical protein [Halomontanus rarus]|uniref:hypothetical protein n=1 Tax=Halomontanus rarus TaxID=3034020 RepID=UPI001A9A21C2
MVEVRQTKLHRAYSKIVDEGQDVHISGQPGIGKTEFFNNLQERLSDGYHIEEKVVSEHHEPKDLENDLLNLARTAANQRDLQSNQLISFSFGLPSFFSGGATKDDRERDLHKLESLTSDWSGTPLLLFVDDIHKIADDENVVRGVISEFSAALGENVQMITAGQISASRVNDIEDIPLTLYSLEETRVFLEDAFDDLTDDIVQDVHSRAEGHPLYLRLLIESTDDIEELRLSRDEVYTTIEERYLDSLEPEIEQFLRQVAPLPELDEKTCHGIVDNLSVTEITRILRTLNQRGIVQKVNRTDDGDNLYKIHEHFRKYLAQKHQNQDEVHRNAFQYHIYEISEKIPNNGKEAWANSLPHSFYAQYHLREIYGDNITADHFLEEMDRLNLSYPRRGLVVVYTSIGVLPEEALNIWDLEFPVFNDWLSEEVENEPLADFIKQLVEWWLSQFQDDPKRLEDIEVDASLDDLPIEEKPVEELDISKQHAKQLRISRDHVFQFFLGEEYYHNKAHQEQALKLFDRYGISLDVAIEFKDTVISILSDSEVEDELDHLTDQYHKGVGELLEESLMSRIDVHQISHHAMDLGQEMFETLHYDIFLSSGTPEELAIEGGEVLEDAENPAFAMMWYALCTTYFRENWPDSEVFDEVKDRYLEQRENRRIYEEELEEPIFEVEETSKAVVLEGTDADDSRMTD